MNIKNSLVSAIRALKKNKMRTALTSVGVIIGVSSVIAMIGIGNSASTTVKDLVHTFGTNAISVFSFQKRFSMREIDQIKQSLPQVKYITPIISHDASFIKYRGKSRMTRCFGVNDDYFKILQWSLGEGSFFQDSDYVSMEKVVIIGNTIKKEFFPYEDPLGKVLLINLVPFRIIGVMEEMGFALSGRDTDNPVFVPYTTAEVKIVGKKDAHMINMAVESELDLESTEKNLRKYMKKAFNLEESPTFRIVTSKKQLETFTKISTTLSYLLAGIASISLFVGGVGIMNIMLVSVSERTREIGIRMAIGAKGRDILMQFLVESVMLSSLGGVTGILFGLFIYFTITIAADWPYILSASSVILSFLFAAAVGIIFGFYPAKKASELNPIDALRHE